MLSDEIPEIPYFSFFVFLLIVFVTLGIKISKNIENKIKKVFTSGKKIGSFIVVL